MRGVTAVLHAATLHKPHVASHSRQAFVDINVTGTLNLLEAAVAEKRARFIYTSTTSSFGDALTPPAGAPAAWITEDVAPIPKNIYGVTKVAAEDLCQLFHRNQRLPCLVLRTSRFFPEQDDVPRETRGLRRRQPQDQRAAVSAGGRRRRGRPRTCARWTRRASWDSGASSSARPRRSRAPTPPSSAATRRGCSQGRCRSTPAIYSARGWKMLPTLDRVYDNERARLLLGWQPQYDFRRALQAIAHGADWRSPLARAIGSKGYHRQDGAA